MLVVNVEIILNYLRNSFVWNTNLISPSQQLSLPQVFYASEAKGWGLRTIDELPKGAFVCEYVGEIVTNMELYDRTIQTTGNARHTYPVLLDADWGSEGVLKDEEALCLDATFYGNIGRFVNHRYFTSSCLISGIQWHSVLPCYYELLFSFFLFLFICIYIHHDIFILILFKILKGV